jgi:deoxyribodipyrimidine photo-lyase
MNWALLYAQELALEHKVPLIVLYNLAPGFLGGGLRQHLFKLGALQSVKEQLQKKDIPFFLVTGDQTEKDIVAFAKEHGVGALVTDFSPLKIQRRWVDHVKKSLLIPFYKVDAHNIVPCWVASPKQEFGAYTIRPKIHKLLPTYMDHYPALHTHPYAYEENVPEIPWKKLEEVTGIDRSVAPVDWIEPSHTAAEQALKHFITDRLDRYGTVRNDSTQRGQSDLSPYLHYGILSAQCVAQRVADHVGMPIEHLVSYAKNNAKVDEDRPLSLREHAGAFLEELIIRRELADNFCFYNQSYDSTEGFPAWAKATHDAHRSDTRAYIYTDKEFEGAKTHDALWNASQNELLKRGKISGYMRMYWAKKILEWTATPEDAMRIAIWLNDKYELDGRDPNGYAGIAWSIGGVHDRAWFDRPVFGQIRYMAESGCKKKFDTETYIARWNSGA